MSDLPITGTRNRAILLMITAIFCFTLMDACAKALVPRIGLLPTVWARYAGQMLLAAAACYSTYSLLTRRLGPDEDVWTSLYYTGLVGTVLLTIAVPFFWQPPDPAAVGLIGLITLFGTFGQLALIRAFSRGEASMLAPYSYTGLLFAALRGAFFFAERPDFRTIFGALVIARAGLYVWHRETCRL